MIWETSYLLEITSGLALVFAVPHTLGSFWIMSRRPARGGSTSWTRCWGCSTYKDPQLLPEGVGDGVRRM